LPRRTDDERDNVVNMSDPDYMDTVAINQNAIQVGKGTSNTYSVYVEPLNQQRLDIGNIREIEGATNVTGPPLDVVFVLDESGSMEDPASAGTSTEKIAAAQNAIQNFVGTLNESKDRVGLVGYSQDVSDENYGPTGDYCADYGSDFCAPPRPSFAPDEQPAWIYTTNDRYLTSSYDAFNTTVETTIPRYGTFGSSGLSKANQALHLKSNQTREQVVIFLSDGQFNGETHPDTNNDNEAARLRASISASQGATVYTVGFGDDDDLDEDVLEDMAQRTGGEYKFADNQEELNDIFLNISRNIATTRQIALTPTSTNVTTAGGGVFAPQITGDTDELATATRGGQEFVNINDPTAPTHFTHAFAATDGETVTFNASTFNCAEWRATGRTRTNGTTGETFDVARCVNMTSTADTLAPTDVEIFTDGSDLEPLLTGTDDPAWWQNSLNESIEERSDLRNGTDWTLRTKSNQALVVLDYPDGINSTNKLALVYQIGRAESDAKADDVVNVRVRNVKARD
jgi:Mg-chelatase subunit ChlD